MNTLWKPQSQGSQNPGGASFLAPYQFKNVSVVDSKGNVLDNLQSGAVENGTYKYWTNKPGSAYGTDAYVRGDLGNGKYSYFKVGDASQRVSNNMDTSKPEQYGDFSSAMSMSPDSGGSGGGGGASAGRFTPGSAGAYGFFPAYMGAEFPKAKDVKSAPYNYTDPQKFAETYGDFNRSEMSKNFSQAQGFALDAIDTELQGLQHYAPAAAALQQTLTANDNAFNQGQRTSQVNAALPGVNDQLNAQGKRAETYASGKLPDGMGDAGLELGVRSQAADTASAGGFGASSGAARKASSLMSATQRLQIGQYGEQLLGSNIGAKANLNLAPTEYANAGSQIKTSPTVSGSQLAQQNFSDINANSLISPTTALQSTVQQNQFTTSQEQATRQFNATNQNTFAMDKFNYDVNYAGSVAGAYQTNVNTTTAIDQQAKADQLAREQMHATQTGNMITAGIGALGSIVGGAASLTRALSSGGGTVTNSSGDTFTVSGDGRVSDSSGNVIGTVDSGGNFSTSTTPSGTTSADLTGGSSNAETGGSTNDTTPGMTPVDGGSSSSSVTPPSDNSSVATPDVSGGSTSADMTGGSSSMEGGFSAGDATIQQYGRTVSPQQVINTIQSPAVKAFASESKLSPQALVSVANADHGQLESVGAKVLSNAGITTKPTANSVPAWTNTQGQQVYVDKNLANDHTTTPGVQAVSQLSTMLKSLQVPANYAHLDNVQKVASNGSLLAQLDTHAANKDLESFMTALFGAISGSAKDLGKMKAIGV